MIPVVCIVGKHNAGKTTLMEKLIPCLEQRGRRVAVIKHAAHGVTLDREGSDSWRLAQTGARAVTVSAPGHAATFIKTPDDVALPRLVSLLPMLEVDLVLVEGFKRSDYPKIEVHRSALGPDLLLAEENLNAVVTDSEQAYVVPRFHTDDAQSLAAYVDERLLRPHTKRDAIRIVIDGEEIPVNAFASAVVSGGILGMLSALRGVSEPANVSIEIRSGRGKEDP